jgi:Na+-translocating ferredoxin:NAD+ oxidoreductase RnfE subunit
LAGIGHNIEMLVFPSARSLLAVMALSVGIMGTYYWNAFQQSQEFEEIDSALLADELPPSAYLDRGFHVWLERASDSSSQ